MLGHLSGHGAMLVPPKGRGISTPRLLYGVGPPMGGRGDASSCVGHVRHKRGRMLKKQRPNEPSVEQTVVWDSSSESEPMSQNDCRLLAKLFEEEEAAIFAFVG